MTFDIRKLNVGDFLWVAREKVTPVPGRSTLQHFTEMQDYLITSRWQCCASQNKMHMKTNRSNEVIFIQWFSVFDFNALLCPRRYSKTLLSKLICTSSTYVVIKTNELKYMSVKILYIYFFSFFFLLLLFSIFI